jgi:hypothetical protein
VYQYYFVGKRDAFPDAPEAPATEYVFDVSPDRKLTYAISVFLRADALEAWADTHGRSLTEAEQYAAVKLRFFEGLDAVSDVATSDRRFLIGPENLDSLLQVLSLD